MLCPEALTEFKEIYRGEFDIELPDDEALELAEGLMGIFEMIAKRKNNQG